MRKIRKSLIALLTAMVLVAAACSDTTDDGAEVDASEGTDETTESEAEEPSEEEPSEEETTGDEPAEEEEAAPAAVMSGGTDRDFSVLAPATGETIVVGLVNTEGPAGLDFPEIRTLGAATVQYLNDHGGFGGRVVQLETCNADGSPEGSQACAQELAGKDVEMVFLGLDLFPDYATYDAEGINVIGAIPLFPADYAAEVVYLSGGNFLLNAGIVGVAIEEFGASSVAIVSGDNAGQNSSEAALIEVLEANEIEFVSIKGGNDETDAGFQALVSQALNSEPDVLVSLYGDAGCIGMMRGRAALGTDIPVLASNTCIAADVLEAAGDAADGWFFVGGADEPVTVEHASQQAAAAIEVGGAPEDVVISSLGLGNLSQIMFLTTAAAANDLAAGGGEITGESVYDHLLNNPNGDLRVFPGGAVLDCGAVAASPSVCNWETPIGEYADGGAPRLTRLDVTPFLP